MGSFISLSQPQRQIAHASRVRRALQRALLQRHNRSARSAKQVGTLRVASFFSTVLPVHHYTPYTLLFRSVHMLLVRPHLPSVLVHF